MPAISNARHERFAQALASGMTADAAYEEAGYKPNRGNASTLKANQSILDRVAEFQEAGAKSVAIDKAWVLKQLQENHTDAKEAGQYSASNKALELIGVEIGMFVKRQIVGLKPIAEMNEDEVLALLGGEPDAEALRAHASAEAAGAA